MNNEEYVKVDVTKYVKEGLESGVLEPIEAVKTARIIAVQGNVGDVVVSWSEDSMGNEVREKEAVVSLDEETQQPGWIVTKADENGNAVVDGNGHTNQWIISDSKFRAKYEEDIMNPGVFKPKGATQMFVQIPDNIILHQWGDDMQIAAGGYINITNADDMYGISARDFADTYKVSEVSKKDSDVKGVSRR